MTNVEALLLIVLAAVALVGTPWLFIISVLAVTQPQLTTMELFKTAVRRLGRLSEVATGVFFLAIIVAAWTIFIGVAVSRGWLQVIKM
jgi:hypothetical protein